ncbi:amidohydrolase [Streptomyces sp. NBC_00249]|uniref:amidohydrolase family protein n=1 Tax=Streptomyces sp. NBC_00249 TaxID=2975690 RepID=UPI002258F067|nr:amidohydrolase family protein [Streptomyces sp. NBC_00249]MCX5197004.1 amidohydrolase [Streptomyces sp. NBC_00249]
MPEYGSGGFGAGAATSATAARVRADGAAAPDDGSGAVIDVHHHFCAPQWRAWAEGKGLVNPKALPPWARWEAGAALDVMDRAGIAVAVLKPMLPARYEGSAQLREAVAVTLEAAAAAVEAHPGRFVFHAPLFLEDQEASLWALRYGLDELGAVGVNVTANHGGVYLGDPSYDRIFAELDERSAVVDTHPHNLPGGPPGAATVPGLPNFLCDFLLDTTRAAANMIRNRTLDRFPNLSVILPHGGGFLPHIATRMEAFGGCFDPPVEPAVVRDHLHRFYYDTAGPLSPAGTLLATAGADRILFGSDWPAAPAAMVVDVAVPALAADPAFTALQRRGVNRENALRLMPRLAAL